MNASYRQFRDLEVGAERREAVRGYLEAHRGIVERVSGRAGVHRSVVSKVLHGRAVSAPVEQAIAAEEGLVEAQPTVEAREVDGPKGIASDRV